jgi:PAS domain S-box-containing protein
VTAREFGPEALLGAIIEMSDDAIFTCEVGGRIATWSVTAERLFGRSAEEVTDGPIDVPFRTT